MKKNISLILFASIFALMLSACDQDPMAKKSAELKNAMPINNLPQKPQPVESSLLQITAPDSITFAETVRGNFTLSAKALKEGYEKVTFEIENMEEFEGATLDPKDGEFVWTPKKGTVRNGNFQQYSLNIRAYALPVDPKGQIITRARQVRIDVNRTFSTPTITKVENFPKSIREEDRKDFYIEVVDFDSGADANDAPIVQFFDASQSSINLSSTIHLAHDGTQFFPNEKRWRFHFEMNLRGIEATSSSALYYLGIRAVNKFGFSSTKNEIEGRVYTKISSAETNWDSTIRLKPDVPQTISFIVYDPKGEANLLYKDTTFVAKPGATLNCQGAQVKICDFTITPKGKIDEEDYQTFKFDFVSSNKDTSDSRTETKHFYLYYYVEQIPAQPIVKAAKGGF